MARISTSQVHADSVDDAALSIVTAPQRANESRYGAVYDSTNLAAMVPIHFHPISSSEYLVLFSRRWHAATHSSDDPGSYTDYTEVIEPGWFRVSVPTGQRTLVGDGFSIPTRNTYTSTELIDAVSRANDYLYLLMSVTTDTTTTGLVSNWSQNTTTGAVTSLAEEELPPAVSRPPEITELAWETFSAAQRTELGSAVTFDRGLWFSSPHLVVFGADEFNRLYLARKPWSRIGYNLVARPGDTLGVPVVPTAEDPRWSFWTGDGWSTTAYLAQPLADVSGAAITSLGPVSVATYRDRTLLATVAAKDTNRFAQIYIQRGSRGWEKGDGVALGSDSEYLDVLRWQQQVPPGVATSEMTNQANEAAIPYVFSTLIEVSGENAHSTLGNTWALWPILRTGSPAPVLGTPLDAALAVTSSAEIDTVMNRVMRGEVLLVTQFTATISVS